MKVLMKRKVEDMTILAYQGEEKKVVIIVRTDASPIPVTVVESTADKYKDMMTMMVKKLPLKLQCESGKSTYRNFIDGGIEK